MKNKLLTFIIAMFLLVVSSTSVLANTCMVGNGGGPLFPDSDCDGIIDAADNCAFTVNPLQRDAEGNGRGDMCDVVIESIRTSPADFVYNGRAFNTFVTVHNNRDYNLRNVKIRVFMPDLGIESVQYIDNLDVCSAKTIEFFLRAPICSPLGDYKIVSEISFMNEFGIYEVIPGITSIRIVPDKYCQMILSNNQVIGNTMIDVMEIQDVYKGSEAVFPIKIANREFNSKEYVFSVTGLDGWGNFRLEPSSLLVVGAGRDDMTNLYIKANENIPPGERVFVVSIKSGDEVQRFLLIANVKEPLQPDRSFMWFFALKVLIIVGIIVLIIGAVILGLKKYIDNAQEDVPNEYY